MTPGWMHMPGLRKEMPWTQMSARKLYRETNAMAYAAYAGMRAHDSTFQLEGKQEDNAGQNRSKTGLSSPWVFCNLSFHTSLPISTCSKRPRSSEIVRAAQVVGAFFHEWIHAKQALGHRCTAHVFNLSALRKTACSKCNI